MSAKYKLLLYCILLDLIGMASFLLPLLGEYFDILWAPLSGYIMMKLFKGTEGKIAGLISFVEEIGILGTDLVPTFTLTWMYKFLIAKEKD